MRVAVPSLVVLASALACVRTAPCPVCPPCAPAAPTVVAVAPDPVVDKHEVAPGLFPLRGYVLGKTTMSQLLGDAGGQCQKDHCRIDGINFWFHDHTVFDGLYLTYTDPMPKEWRERLGFDWKLSYEEWKTVLGHRQFKVNADEPPTQVDYEGKKVFHAKIVATRAEAVRAEVLFNFDYEPGDATTRGTLYSISVKLP